MKRIFRLCALLLLFGVFGTLFSPLASAAPAEKGLIRVIGGTSARRGEEIAFEIELNRNPGVACLRLTLQYDRAALELLSVEDKSLLPNADFTEQLEAEKFVLQWQDLTGNDLVQTGRLCAVKFRVKTDAPYSAQGVSLSYSAAELDLVDHHHNRVPFEIEGAKFTVPCLHPNAEEKILREASLDKAGEKQISCKACGTTITQTLLPTLESEDQSIKATVFPGEFTDTPKEGEETAAPSIFLEKITAGNTFDKAILSSAVYNGTVTDVFAVHFTRGGEAFVPLGEVRLTLSRKAVTIDEYSVLYRILPDGKTEKVDFEKNGGISFLYSDSTYFLMDSSLPPLKEEEPAETSAPPASADEQKPADENTRPSILLPSIGLALLLLVIAFIIFFLRRPKKDHLD